MAPQRKPARVTVLLTDGRQCTRTCYSARGDFERPYQEAEVREKFRTLAGLVLRQEGSALIEAAIDQCEHWPSIKVLPDLLRRNA
jgi:2-methylcitrate dehydratase PrpD